MLYLTHSAQQGRNRIQPLARGLLTGKIRPGHQFNEGDTRNGNAFYSDENITRVNAFLDKLKPLAKIRMPHWKLRIDGH